MLALNVFMSSVCAPQTIGSARTSALTMQMALKQMKFLFILASLKKT
jgi:hypothetical protein